MLIAGVILPSLFFTGLALYPVADRRLAGGRPPRGLLPPKPADPANRTAGRRGRRHALRPAVGRGANDQIAYHLHLDLYTVTWMFRVLVLAGPAVAFGLTQVICHALADRRRNEERHYRGTGHSRRTCKAATPKSASQFTGRRRPAPSAQACGHPPEPGKGPMSWTGRA